MTALMAEGIPCGSGSCSEIYLEKAFEGNGLHPAARPLNFCPSCHCEERSDEAISWFIEWFRDCFVGFWPPRNDKWRVIQDKGLAGRLPVARELGETSLMFMVHPTLSADDREDVVRAMDKVMRAAVR